ncbi:hypothetical protein FRB95_010538 [Tulasnella sp. JGI-2019a]|nr:hypothetical protein FRB95_010538 [Tulasnella sp. JGI-2019a]
MFHGLALVTHPHSIPVEIWIHIVKEIARPNNPSSYRLDPACTTALAQVCLGNSTFNAIAEPLLYSRAFITPHTVECFSQTVAMSGMNSGESTPSAKGRMVSVAGTY